MKEERDKTIDEMLREISDGADIETKLLELWDVAVAEAYDLGYSAATTEMGEALAEAGFINNDS